MAQPQVHWHEGLFLQPHHLQYSQTTMSQSVASERQLAWSYPYGVMELELQGGALDSMLIQFTKLKVVMQSGLIVSFPENATLPTRNIERAFDMTTEPFMVYLAVPLWNPESGNAVPEGGDLRTKRMYSVSSIDRLEENEGIDRQALLVRKINAQLLVEGEDDSDFEKVPIMRISHALKDETHVPVVDKEYVPPCMTMSGAPDLKHAVSKLLGSLNTKRRALMNRARNASAESDTLRGTMVTHVLRLQAVGSACERLREKMKISTLPPFEIFLELRSLVGQLAALKPEFDADDDVSYDHTALAQCFHQTIGQIYGLLRETQEASYLKEDFTSDKRSLTISMKDEYFERPNAYFLAIKSRQDVAQVVSLVQDRDRFKLLPPGEIAQAIFGVLLQHETLIPYELPSDRSLHYFRLDLEKSRRIWRRVEKEKGLSLFWENMTQSDFEATLYMTLPENEGTDDAS